MLCFLNKIFFLYRNNKYSTLKLNFTKQDINLKSDKYISTKLT